MRAINVERDEGFGPHSSGDFARNPHSFFGFNGRDIFQQSLVFKVGVCEVVRSMLNRQRGLYIGLFAVTGWALRVGQGL